MWKIWLLNLQKKRAGVTLVELIVTFVLIGLFMTAASFMLTSSLNMFTRMQSVSSAVTVSDVLLDKIAGEIAAAKEPNMDKNYEALDGDGYYIWLGKDEGSEWITMWNRSGSPIAIYGDENGKLCLKYYETVRRQKGAAVTGDNPAVPEMNWHFDEGVYMGYRITERDEATGTGGLTFSRDDPDNHPNVIRIDLEIQNERTGFTYQATRYAECYNYKFKQEQVKKYLGLRKGADADKEKMPETALEFLIKKDEGGGGGPEPEPEPPEERVEYTIYFYSDFDMKKELEPPIVKQGRKGDKIIVEGSTHESSEGKTVIGPFPIKYYEYAPYNSSDMCILDGIKPAILTLFYTPSKTDLVPITIICIDAETGKVIDKETKGYQIESEIRIEPKEIEGYESVSVAQEITVSATTLEFRFDYISVEAGDGSVIVTDSQGNKHILKWYMNWNEIRSYAIDHNGYYRNDPSLILCDETGFYVAINGLEVPSSIGKKTLEQFAKTNNKIIKITKNTKIHIKADTYFDKNSSEMKWKQQPERGDLAYDGTSYYIAPGKIPYTVIPPGTPWIKLTELNKGGY